LNKQNIVFVISAPAGTGKNTLTEMLFEEFDNIKRSVSVTTRQPRGQEINGVDYFYISKQEFKERIKEKEFLEYAEIYGEYYGTSKDYVDKILKDGKHVILVIDVQGAKKIKKLIPAVFIFLMPPSIEELKRRLCKRNTDSEGKIKERLRGAEAEIQEAKYYDYIVVNDDLDVAYDTLRSIIIAEENKNRSIVKNGKKG
jgi:guanylate kinase